MTTITSFQSRGRALAWVAIALAATVVATTLGAYGYHWRIQNSIQHEDPTKLITGARPKKLNDALNILMMGSDTRAGANAQYGRSLRNKLPASDTMILLHLSPGGRAGAHHQLRARPEGADPCWTSRMPRTATAASSPSPPRRGS